MSTEWRLGTIGFGYDDWVGPFYPPRSKSSDFLEIYAKHFGTVELDTTFHAIPTRERVQKWASTVPEGFRFSVKTPRIISHEPPLAKVVTPMLEFVDVLRDMGDKLGVVLIQFPPSFPSVAMKALTTFLDALPGDVRFAVELRHPSWYNERPLETTRAMLAERRICWVSMDHEGSPARVIPTTDFLYLRLIGKHKKYAYLGEEQADVEPQLAWWKSQLDLHLPQFKQVHVLIGNDFSGYAIGALRRFARRIDVDLSLPEGHSRSSQGSLFDGHPAS